MKDWIFVGDAHFALGDGKRRDYFTRFIRANRPSVGTLVIMGDFFDFWFGFRHIASLRKEYEDILDLLEGLRSEGVEIIYLEGNHDFRLGPYMREELGIQVYDRSAELELDGTRVYLAHGDRAHPKPGHKVFSFLIKNWFTYTIISWLGPRIVIAIAKWLSTHSRRHGVKEVSEIIHRLRRFAHHKLNEGFDAVVLAHTHLPEAMALEKRGGEGYYFNVGNWMRDFSYLRYNSKKGFSLEYFPTD